MNMCGRGDKDIYSISEHLGVKNLTQNVKQNRSKICCSEKEKKKALVTFVTSGRPRL